MWSLAQGPWKLLSWSPLRPLAPGLGPDLGLSLVSDLNGRGSQSGLRAFNSTEVLLIWASSGGWRGTEPATYTATCLTTGRGQLTSEQFSNFLLDFSLGMVLLIFLFLFPIPLSQPLPFQLRLSSSRYQML